MPVPWVVLLWEFIWDEKYVIARNFLIEHLADKVNEPVHLAWDRGHLLSLLREYRRRWRTLNHICQQWENEGYTVPDTKGVFHIDWINIQRGTYANAAAALGVEAEWSLVDHWCNAEFAADLEIYENLDYLEDLLSWTLAGIHIGMELIYPPYTEAGCVLIHMIRFKALSQSRALWQAPRLGG